MILLIYKKQDGCGVLNDPQRAKNGRFLAHWCITWIQYVRLALKFTQACIYIQGINS